MEGWAEFTREVQQYYGVDMACLGDQFRREQKGAHCRSHLIPDSLRWAQVGVHRQEVLEERLQHASAWRALKPPAGTFEHDAGTALRMQLCTGCLRLA